MKRNRYDMWYIWRAACPDGRQEWRLQFPLAVARRWWNLRPDISVTSFDTWTDARDYMLRVQRQAPRVAA